MKKWLILFGVVVITGVLVGYHTVFQGKIENEEEINRVQEEVIPSNLSQQIEEKQEEVESENKEDNNENQPKIENLEKKEENEKVEENIKVIQPELVSASNSNLSNQTCAWGFVRGKDGKKPEFYGPHSKVLDSYEGIYCSSSDAPIIYLTFDEGYENGYTSSILDTLKEKNVTSIFFVTMPYVKQNPELVKRMIEEGHLVGNHTVNHPSMPSVTDDEKLRKEIMDLHDYVKDNFNYEMTFLRPPKGEYSERTVKMALDLGYRTVLWSAAYDDWDTSKQDRLNYARGMILNNLHPGEVMLLHAVSKDNAALLGEVIDEARNRGYEFRVLEEFE